MIDRLRVVQFGTMLPRRWRSLAGLAVMLAAIVQSAQVAQSLEGPPLVGAVVLLGLVMSIAWFLMLGPLPRLGIWMLGGASVVLALASPVSGAVIGVVSAIVVAGLRLPARQADSRGE